MKLFKKLYDWMLRWAETPYGPLALFFLAMAESSFFPIPPDALLIALCLGAAKKSFRFALYCTVGSIIGGMLGYLIGFGLWGAVDSFFFAYIPGFSEELFQKVMVNFNEYGFWYVFSAGFTPIPYKIFTIASGAFKMNFFLFVLASALSRSLRFFTVAFLFWKFGPSIKKFIDKYFNFLAVLFILLILAGFLVIKFLF